MNRISARMLAGLAGLALPAAALGQSLVTNQPQDLSDIETAGPNSLVSLTFVEAADQFANGDTIEILVSLIAVDAADNQTTLLTNLDVTSGITGAPTFAASATDTQDLVVDLSSFENTLTLGVNAAPAGTVSIIARFTIDDATANTSGNEIVTTLTTTNGVIDGGAESAVYENGAVSITGAFLDSSGANPVLNLTFSRTLNNQDAGAFTAGNDPNQTTAAEVAALAAADFQIDTDGFGTGNAPGLLTNFTSAAFVGGSNGTAIALTLSNGTNATVGNFVNFGTTNAADDVTDFLGNQVNNDEATAANNRGDADGVQITALAALTITGASAEEIITGDAAVADAIRVQYNLPLNPADLGNVAFYSDFLQNTTGDSDLAITAVNADPNDSSAVLLTIDRVDAAPDENLWADALDDDGNAFTLLTQAVAAGINEPGSIFDGADAGANAEDDYAGAQSLTISDSINPSVDGFAFLDSNGDGVLDAVAVFGNEPITTSSLTAGDFNIDIADGVQLQPIALLDSEGDFPAPADLPTSDTGTITPSGVNGGDVRVSAAGAPDRLGVGNAVVLPFDPTAVDWSGAGAGTNAPGTDGPGTLLDLDHPAFTITDGNSNDTSVAAGTDVNVNTDRAAPVVANTYFLTGDNIADNNRATFETTLSQNIAENDGTVGDQQLNDRLVFVFGEDITLGASATFLDDLTIDGAIWNDDLGGTSGASRPAVANNNKLFLENIRDGGDGNFTDGDEVAAVAGYGAGSVAAFSTSATVEDAADNPASVSEAAVDRTAPYIRLLTNRTTPAQPLDSAFLIDDDGDNLADRVLVSFTEAVLAADLNAADFEVTDPATGVSISNVVTANGGASDASIFLTISGTVSMDSSVEITYEGTDADTNDRLLEGATSGNEVSGIDTIFDAERVQEPVTDGQQIAIQTITGSGLSADGGTFNVGTRIVAFLGVPVVERIDTTHNNVRFVYDWSEGNYGGVATSSFEAWTDYLWGIEDFVYLTRQNSNIQTFVNEKDDSQEGASDGDDFAFNTDILQLSINASRLDNITFNTTGEKSGNRANGSAQLRWDLFRSNDGTLVNLFNNGYEVNGEPIIAGETVVTETDGSFVLNVTGPSSRFWAKSRISTMNLPIIIVVEETDGTRTFATSILDGVSGPLVFNPANTRQNQNGSAPANTIYNLNLANAGTQFVYTGWNLLAFDRVGGYARANNDIPLLPSGVAAGDVTTASALPRTDAFDQFVYWSDTNGDGVWTSADDGGNEFDSFVIDNNIFDTFTFTLDDSGVRTDGSAFVGGYAAGFYYGNNTDIGVTQFGPALNATSIFPTATPFPNDNSTLGWGLFTVTDGRGTTVGETQVLANNTGLDLILQFLNDGNGVEIQNSAAQDFEADSPFAIFGHYIDQ